MGHYLGEALPSSKAPSCPEWRGQEFVMRLESKPNSSSGLLARIRAYLAQMDSEQRERRSSKLLIMAADEIERLSK